jgi:hypothetical protein
MPRNAKTRKTKVFFDRFNFEIGGYVPVYGKLGEYDNLGVI